MQQSDFKKSTRGPETRQRLLDFGLAAFTKKSSSGVNLVEDVLRPANISIGSFYYQFTDKTELLCEVLYRAIECRQVAVNEVLQLINEGLSFEESIHGAVSNLFDSFDNLQHGWQMQIRESTHEDIAVRRIITKGREKWTSDIGSFVEKSLGIDGAEAAIRGEQAVIYGTGLAKFYLELPTSTRKNRRTQLIYDGTNFLIAGLSLA